MRTWVLMAALLGLCACGQSGAGGPIANEASKTTAAKKVKHPNYCFFKDANTKAWTASRDKSGNVIVKGKAYLDDSRYKGDLVTGEAEGDKASIWLTMAMNGGPYASPDNWWDVRATIPNSAAAKSLSVMCGTKTVAMLAVK
jgi:hypothetical protein